MKQHIVEDGERRLKASVEFRDRLRKLHESVRARHSTELSEAGFFRRLVLRLRIAREYRRERSQIGPSPYSLYFR